MKVRVWLGVFWLVSLGLAYWSGRGMRMEPSAFDRSAAPAFFPKGRVESRGPEGNAGPSSRGDGLGTGSDDWAKVLAEWNPSRRREGLKALARQMAQADPTAAWEKGLSISGLADRQVFCETVLDVWAQRSPEEALKSAQALPAGELQASCLHSVMRVWAQKAPLAAIEYATQSLTGSGRQMAVSAIASEWAQQDPAAAATWAQKNSQTSSGLQAVRAVMDYWGQIDPAAGANWAASLPKGDFQETALQSLLIQWTDQYPEEAATWITGKPEMLDMVDLVASNWSKSDPKATLQWLEKLPTGKQRSEAQQVALATWAAAAPTQALDWVARQGGSANQALTEQVLSTWAVEDPQEAYRWASSRPGAASFVPKVLEQWSSSHPTAFLSWADAQPASARTDDFQRLRALAQAQDSPQRAVTLAAAIKDPDVRALSLEQVLGLWEDADPKAAADWKAKNPSLLSP
ncbi:MAG: hypothetical protein SFU85_00600 [Candidatus Methylacidiphilales bacterium]|nr:hypothetical protein [Candidatus Methylacidiphilales bacterium]